MLLESLKELNSKFIAIKVEDVVPITYSLGAAPYIASDRTPLDLQKLNAAVLKLEKICDVLIIEGAGGLYVPLDDEYMMIDMIEYFQAATLLVTHCSLGCINDTLLSEKALQDREMKFVTVFNCKESDVDFVSVSEPYFAQTRKKVLKTSGDIDTICDVLYNAKI